MKNTAQKFLILSLIFCALNIEIAAQTCTPAPSGLVSWYRAENNANDSQGANDGTLQNGAVFAAGKVGQSFAFDGVDDFLEIPDGATNSNTSGTWEFWFKTSQPNTTNGAGLIGKHEATSSLNGITIFIYIGKLSIQIKPGSNIALNLEGSSVVNDGQFHHAALTFQSGGAASLYIDGSLADSGNAPSFSFASNPIRLARLLDQYWAAYNGAIDEFSVYNRALSASEIQAIFNAGSAGKCFAPTAASVQVGGRVVTARGRGIFRAQVSLTDSSGETRRVSTNPFGYYRFEDVPAGETYIISASAKRYTFSQPTQVLNINEDTEDVNFIAYPIER